MHYRSLPLGILGLTLHRKRRTSVSRPPGYLTLITVVGLAVHLGSALNEEELGALKAAARQRLVDGRASSTSGWVWQRRAARWRSPRRVRRICGTRAVTAQQPHIGI